MNVTEYNIALARAMKEKELQAKVSAAMKQLGWRSYHTWQSLHSEKGFPDIVALRGSRGIAVELKREDGKRAVTTQEQVDWLRSFEAAGFEQYVWRPSDLLSGRVHEVLT